MGRNIDAKDCASRKVAFNKKIFHAMTKDRKENKADYTGYSFYFGCSKADYAECLDPCVIKQENAQE